MEPLHKLFELATARCLLAPLARVGMKQRISIFADDVMLFVKPSRMDLAVTADILEAFGEASGLWVNQSKSAAFAIRCSDDQKLLVGQSLGFSFGHFPCKYLGLPLTIRKQTHAQL